MKIHEIFLTIYFWGIAIPVLLITYVLGILFYPFLDEKSFARFYELSTAKTMLYFMTVAGFWSVTVKDNRKDKTWIDKYGEEKRFVVIANHVSYIDSLVCVLLPLKRKYMIAELFTKIPVFGFLTKCSGFVVADRNNPTLNKTAVERAVNAIKIDQCSFQIYPSGRRELIPYTTKDEILKTGAFRIARQTCLPILPVTLKGTYEGMHGIIAGLTSIEIIIDEPFYVTDEDYPKWVEKSRDIFCNNLEK